MTRTTEPACIESVNAAGFVALLGGESRQIDWISVQTVTAFKRDAYIVDVMCLVLLCGEPATILEVRESDACYQALVAGVDAHLPGATPFAMWFFHVAFPAFEANALCIYRRGGQPDEIATHAEGPPVPKEKRWWKRLLR